MKDRLKFMKRLGCLRRQIQSINKVIWAIKKIDPVYRLKGEFSTSNDVVVEVLKEAKKRLMGRKADLLNEYRLIAN